MISAADNDQFTDEQSEANRNSVMQTNRSPVATRDKLQAVKEFYESVGQLSWPNLNDPKSDSKLRPLVPFFDKEGTMFITHFPSNFYPDLHLVKDV